MKNKGGFHPFWRIFMVAAMLGFLGICLAIGLFYYIFSIPEPEGLSLASWPETFTDNFSYWMEEKDGAITVRDTGIQRLKKYGLWVQILDETGHEVFAYNKPVDYPVDYTASELLAIPAGAYENGNTVFASKFTGAAHRFSYLIGFPYAIGKYMLYYNGGNVERLSPVVSMVTFLFLGVLILFILGYGFWLTRQLSAITTGITNISHRVYEPYNETGVFRNIYLALNHMDAEVRNSDRIQADTDRTRREWIANITHDLKTPLSPAKGYAELLAELPETELQDVQEYGAIIVKNLNHAERLINDLKLTYQLEAGAIPYQLHKIRLIRYIKELVIDVINDPAFAERDIAFESHVSDLLVLIDPDLFRRALQNLVMNALVHTAVDTKVEIVVDGEENDQVRIIVRDYGAGMSEAEQAELFDRYYRGANTKERPDGSGLGLAIAKQIVLLHHGTIAVKSSLNKGSEFTITLPVQTRS